jgi:probable rRNA maturation factor
MKPELDLTLQIASARAGVPHRRSIERWMLAALEQTAIITLRYADAPEARRLNRAYRQRDYATNVLTFVYPAPPTSRGAPRPPLMGDIVICPSVVAREAREQGKTLLAHHAHLVIHGVLHLQGHDHEHEREAVRMERREQAILAAFGYPDPYVEPVPRSPRSAPPASPRRPRTRSRTAR